MFFVVSALDPESIHTPTVAVEVKGMFSDTTVNPLDSLEIWVFGNDDDTEANPLVANLFAETPINFEFNMVISLWTFVDYKL